ncbi:MAG: 16S rRNA (cytosine(1402)-N(4))-methyltransferase RsmH [Bacteroidota bacterium]
MLFHHEPVLCAEALEFLLTDRDGVYVDGTIGGGGHAEAILRKVGPSARLIGFDADRDAIDAAARRLAGEERRMTLIHANFRAMAEELSARGVGAVAGILFDLGVSSHQIDEAEKGFSFRSDERLDMRMDRRLYLSGWDVVNTYPEQRLAAVLYEFGEERASRRIARAIVEHRPIDTTGALKQVVEGCVGGRFLQKSLARVFQAVRIEVNQEITSLEHALGDVPALLMRGGRCVVIAYHSLEDRTVKNFFREEAADRTASGHKSVPDAPRVPRLKILTKKPVTASNEECARNPRARSAKLRAAERT